MKKILKNTITLLLTCCILVSMLCIPAFAANGNITFSDPSVIVGNNVNVTVKVGDAISMCDILLSYDPSQLEFISGSGMEISGSGGTVHINGYNGSGAGTFSCTLTFKALKVCSAKITVSYYDMVDDNGDNVASHIGSSTVTISNPPTASSDATLKALSISPGTLSPSFSSGTTSYTATVSSSTTKLNVSATKNDSKASVSVSGTSLKVGSNKVTVTVTAEDGTKKTYTITVTRPAATIAPDTGNNPGGTPDTDVPEVTEEAYISLVDGGILEVSETIDEDKVPAGFLLTETTVENLTVDAIFYGENTDPAVWLIGDDNNPSGFYFINEEGLGYPMVTLTQPTGGIIMIDNASQSAPDGYIPGKFAIGETEYDAFIKDDGKDPDHCLVYGINSEGETVLYCYDPAEGTFQKFGISSSVEIKEVIKEVEVEVVKEVEVPVEVPAEPEEITLATMLKNKMVFWIAIAIGVVILVLIVLCIMLGIMYSRKSKACQLMASKRSFNTEPLPTIEE
ncbi:MAG: cadherin-like beta sandwich domain-containing protein [Oscillospiraceae bacterium]|nr:cadherin-like beta sandwich domain-containing protein [Oscillospiraceae bacterium]